MKTLLHLIFALSVSTSLTTRAFAQESDAEESSSSTSVEDENPASGKGEIQTRTKRKAPVSLNHLRLGASLITWQESIEAVRASSSTQMRTESTGLTVSATRSKRISKTNWQHYQSAEFSIGTLKGKGSATTIADGLSNQPWYAVGVSPGLMYRTTPVSEAGISLPLVFRMIQWQLNPGSGLQMNRDSSYSAGLRGHFLMKFTPKSSLSLSATYQTYWAATQWAIGWEYLLY